MKATVLLIGVGAVTAGWALEGCGGALGGDPRMTGRGGAVGGTGRGGAAGTTGDGFGQPACLPTVAKGGACTAADQSSCFKPCGPESIGVKSEMCLGGVYVEMSGCAFDASKDYSCYSVPSVVGNPVCGTGIPQASAPCTLPNCTLCNSEQGLPGGIYLDSTGALKVGYCVCSAAGGSGPKWSCAADTFWPCPGSPGCRSVTGAGGSIGIGGASGAGGSGGSGGRGGAGGTSFGGEPACPPTIAKGGACTPTDLQFCYKTCGPEKLGVKSETCQTSGIYAEMSGCTFDPSLDYSCFAIPTRANPICPAGTPPQASGACDVPDCNVCNSLQGLAGGGYVDSTGAAKVGFCVCQPPNSAGMRSWSCASDTQWPCPVGAGCSATGAGGASGAGGATGMGGAGGGSSFGQPACPGTVAKGAPCGSSDVQFCYKTCGPEKTGVKAETCQTSGTYAEMSGCMFDSTVDYSCYKVPTLGNAACGASATPINGSTCDAPACTICNSLEGAPGGSYFDSSGATKVGYCVCQAPNSAGTRTWSCASDTAWPCPGGSGC